MKPTEHPAKPTVPEHDVLMEEARIWLSRLAGAEVTQWDMQAFKRWQSRSPAHAQAFDEAKRQWRAMGPALGQLLHKDPELSARHQRLLQGKGISRRAFLGGMAATAAVGALVAFPPLGLWPAPDGWSADYRTATGEQQQIDLPGEAILTLNTQTSMRHLVLSSGEQAIELISGEAAIDIPAAGQAVTLIAGNGRCIAEAGQIEVRNLDGRVNVTCIHGAVRLEHPAGEYVLAQAQQVRYDTRSVSSVIGIDPLDAGAWRQGELVFKATTLEQVVSEINRYRQGRVILLASGLRDSAVTGRFSIAVLDEALLQIQRSFGLSARVLPGGVLILS